jgi:hypothetical protein
MSQTIIDTGQPIRGSGLTGGKSIRWIGHNRRALKEIRVKVFRKEEVRRPIENQVAALRFLTRRSLGTSMVIDEIPKFPVTLRYNRHGDGHWDPNIARRAPFRSRKSTGLKVCRAFEPAESFGSAPIGKTNVPGDVIVKARKTPQWRGVDRNKAAIAHEMIGTDVEDHYPAQLKIAVSLLKRLQRRKK